MNLDRVNTLTFDIFGTVLDLTGCIQPAVTEFLSSKGAALDPGEIWKQWRARQRIEQHQDTILMLGHGGYLETARRALVYTLRNNGIEPTGDDVERVMAVFERLTPFEDAKIGLERLGKRYDLVALSNGNQWLLDHLCDHNIAIDFKAKISVEHFGRFKPHPAVYRGAARMLAKEPGEIMMVAAHSFDIHGARACGFRGVFVNRYRLPYEDTPLAHDKTVMDFIELCDWLGV
jgi:2-haloacid dehalogenase